MTVEELIELLKEVPPQASVWVCAQETRGGMTKRLASSATFLESGRTYHDVDSSTPWVLLVAAQPVPNEGVGQEEKP